MAVLNSTAACPKTRYSSNMSQELSPTPIAAQHFEDRWAAWQAGGDANDRATQRKLYIVAAILILSVAILNGLWLIQ